MKFIIILIIALLIQSCFSPFDQEVEYRIDPLLESYVNRFFKEAEMRDCRFPQQNLIIKFQVDLKQTHKAWGLSIRRNYQKIILIDMEFFEDQKIYPDRIEALMFHELGHSVLKRKHTTTINSLMNPGRCISGCYENNSELRKMFLDELFMY